MSQLNVNATRHAIRAEERTRANGKLHRVFDMSQPAWWHKYFKWETLTVAGRVIEKGLVVTPTMGLTIVLAIAGIAGGVYWRMNDRIEAKDQAYQEQRDMLIEIKTELKIQKEHEVEFKRKQIEDNELQDLKIQDTKDKLLVVLNSKGR